MPIMGINVALSIPVRATDADQANKRDIFGIEFAVWITKESSSIRMLESACNMVFSTVHPTLFNGLYWARQTPQPRIR